VIAPCHFLFPFLNKKDCCVQGDSVPLKLPAHSPGRKLLQYVRDEAHRFARHYHHILRDKKMLNENR
jgi:excinuclease UvrABC nuclease subunit